jgi:hypothetical protein
LNGEKKCLKWNFLEHTWKDLLIIAIISYETDDDTNKRKMKEIEIRFISIFIRTFSVNFFLTFS